LFDPISVIERPTVRGPKLHVDKLELHRLSTLVQSNKDVVEMSVVNVESSRLCTKGRLQIPVEEVIVMLHVNILVFAATIEQRHVEEFGDKDSHRRIVEDLAVDHANAINVVV
jgi:hypothetical protein